MPDDPTSSSPDDEGEVEDFIEILGDEVPGIGTLRKAYRLLKKKLSKEYREEIRRLRKTQDGLIATTSEQTKIIALLRRRNEELERELEGYKEKERNQNPGL